MLPVVLPPVLVSHSSLRTLETLVAAPSTCTSGAVRSFVQSAWTFASIVRGLYIATVQDSFLILRECSGFSTLGGDDIEDGVPDREQVDCEKRRGRRGRETGERETNTKRQQTHAQTYDIMDGR